MNPLSFYIKALLGIGDVEVFWQARENILNKPGKHTQETTCVKLSENIMELESRYFLISTSL